MIWVNPAAFALLAAIAAPVVIHLLLRRRAVRLPFPSLRFLVASEQSAVRLRRPSDVVLLLVRMAIVGAAAAAIARPLILNDARRQAWVTRTARAIVVDSSSSVNADRAGEAAAAEARGAIATRRFESAAPAAMLTRATAWLRSAEPSLREIVVISDFQRGQFSASDFTGVAPDIGIRLVRVDSMLPSGAFDVSPVLYDGRTYARTVTLDSEGTRVVLRSAASRRGLDVSGAAGGGDRVLAVIASAGAAAPAPDEPIHVRIGERGTSAPPSAWTAPWMRNTVLRMLAAPGMENVVVRAAPRDGTLVLDVAAPADSILAARAAEAALNARSDPRAVSEHEPARVPDDVLHSWTRTPAPPDGSAWRVSTESDGRWLWLAALVLLAIETVLRRERAVGVAREEAHAA